MSKNKLRIVKIFICINLIVILILSAVAFYGDHADIYVGKLSGSSNTVGFFEVLEAELFQSDAAYERRFKKSSLDILSHVRTEYSNYFLKTNMSIGVPYNDLRDAGIRNQELRIVVSSRVDGNRAIGIVCICQDEQEVAQYPYCRIVKDGQVETYLQFKNKWYVTRRSGNNVAIDLNAIITDLKAGEFDDYPQRDYGVIAANIYPANSNIWEVGICGCQDIEYLTMHNKGHEEIDSIFNAYVSEQCTSEIEKIVNWMNENKYEFGVSHNISEIDHINIQIPENIQEIAVEGNVYDLLLIQFASYIDTL